MDAYRNMQQKYTRKPSLEVASDHFSTTFLGDYAIGPFSCLSVLSCLSVTLVYCSQTVGWIRMSFGTEVGLDPGHSVLDGDPALSQKGAQQPFTFRTMSIVVKRSPISATAELLFMIPKCTVVWSKHISVIICQKPPEV